MAKRVILKEGNELIYPYVAPDVTLKAKDVPAEAKVVGERFDKTLQVYSNKSGYTLYDNNYLKQYIISGKGIQVLIPTKYGTIITASKYSVLVFPVTSGYTYIIYGVNLYPYSYNVYYYKSDPKNGNVFPVLGSSVDKLSTYIKFTIPSDVTYIAIGVYSSDSTSYDFRNTITIEEYSNYYIDYGTSDKTEMFFHDDIYNIVKIKRNQLPNKTITNKELKSYIYKNKVYGTASGLAMNFIDAVGWDTVCLPVKQYSTYIIYNKVWDAKDTTVFNLCFYNEFPVNGNVDAVCGIKITEEGGSYSIAIPSKVKYMCFVVKSTSYDVSDSVYIEHTDYSEEFVDYNNNNINIELKENKEVYQSINTPLYIDNKLPFDVPKVKITSSSLNPNATNNTISPLSYTTNPYSAGNPVGDVDTEEVRLDFISSTVNFTDYIEINYQGKTSLADAKKGFGIDLRNKHKFGYWREYDSFHLKAFYEDFCKCRDWVCNILMEQIYVSREPLERRPFQKYNDFTGVSSFYTSNAYCHVEGFPVELYINDVYWGLYIWRTKKNRDNYMFNKSNTNHIFLDSQDWFSNGGSFKWTGVEIRNPKSDSGNTSFEEGVEPNAGEVKTVVETWKDFMWGITTSTSKSDIEEHMNMDEWIDVYLLLYVVNAWDSWSRNTLYGTWDGQHFSPMIYDLNNSFNGFGGKNTGSYTAYYKPDSNTYNQKARSMSWFSVLETLYHDEIVERYTELKNKGIFTAKNIINLFEKFIMIVGQDVYKRDAERWPNCPSLVANNRDYDSIETLNNWISSRMDYMDTQMV